LAFPKFKGEALRRRLGGVTLALALCLTTLLESDGPLVIYATDKGPFARTLEPLFKIGDLLIKVEVKRRRGCFGFKEPDWRGAVGAAYDTEILRLSSGKVLGDSLDVLFSGVMPHSGTIGNSATDNLCVYLPGAEQATPPRGHGEPSESKLLGSKLPFYSRKVTLLLKFTVDLDT
jgi:hypothetical protein